MLLELLWCWDRCRRTWFRGFGHALEDSEGSRFFSCFAGGRRCKPIREGSQRADSEFFGSSVDLFRQNHQSIRTKFTIDHCTQPIAISAGEWGWEQCGEGVNTGVEAGGVIGRLDAGETTGERHNSSKSGVSIISIGSEKVVSSVVMARGELPKFPAMPREGSCLPMLPNEWAMGTVVVVVSIALIGRDSRRWRPLLAVTANEDVGLIIA